VVIDNCDVHATQMDYHAEWWAPLPLTPRSDEPQASVDLTASAASEVTSDPTGLIERLTEAASYIDDLKTAEHIPDDVQGSLYDTLSEAAQALLLQSQKIKELEEELHDAETDRQHFYRLAVDDSVYPHEGYKARSEELKAALSTLRQEHEALSDSHRDLASRLARSGEEAARLTQEVKRKDKALEEIYAASKSDRRLAINMEAINRIARSALSSKEKSE
jgi:chromosome segregation ATPase